MERITHSEDFIEYKKPNYLGALKMRAKMEREMIRLTRELIKETGDENAQITDSESFEVIYNSTKHIIENSSKPLEEIEENEELWPLMMEFIAQMSHILSADKKKLITSKTLPDLPLQK